MTGVELGTAVTLLSKLIGEAYKLNQIIINARAENRNITDAEWATLDSAQKKAHDDLTASIEARDSEYGD